MVRKLVATLVIAPEMTFLNRAVDALTACNGDIIYRSKAYCVVRMAERIPTDAC